jgi:hypothetical protein
VICLALIGVMASPRGAAAAPAGAPPTSVTTLALPGAVTHVTGCDGTTTTLHTDGLLSVRRSSETAGALAVDVEYGGTLTPGTDYEPLPDPVVIAAGSDNQVLSVKATKGGTITVTIKPGAGYTVGSPGTSQIKVTEKNLAATCPPEEAQTIAVGQAPAPLHVYERFGSQYGDTTLVIDGQVPPGLTYAPGGSWSGAATAVGTYRFRAKYCLGPCYLEIPIAITVTRGGVVTTVTATEPPEAAAPPATPVRATAAFTG